VAACAGILRNRYNGSGRWTRKSRDLVGHTEALLTDLGLVSGKHYLRGNDAPRQGWCGNYIRLLSAGRRLKAIRNICTEQTRYETKKREIEHKRYAGRAAERLPIACSEKLDAWKNSGAARNKRLNRDIRDCAAILNIPIPADSDGYREFVQSHAAC
jgi:hypothetical protein